LELSWGLGFGVWDFEIMRILNRAHVPWFIFVVAATLFSAWLYLGNYKSMPAPFRLPSIFTQTHSGHRSAGGTPLGLIFGATAFGIFIFAGLLGLRKKVVLWRLGTLQRWMRAHIWLTLLTIPLILFHSGFRMGGPMTTWLWIIYVIVMVSGIYGLALQHQLPRIMKERLPAETVYEQIPHIRAQLVAAATKMRDSFKPTPPKKTDAGAPAPSATKAVTAGSTPMASTAGELSTPTARAKTVTGSAITAAPVTDPAPAAKAAESPGNIARTVAAPTPQAAAPEEARIVPPPPLKPGETMGTPTARVPEGAAVPAGTESAAIKLPPDKTEVAVVSAAPLPISSSPKQIAPPPPSAPVSAPNPTPPAASASAEHDPDSEAMLVEFLTEQVIPYLSARRGDRLRLGKNRYSEDLFRVVKLRVAELYRGRVEEIQAWCDERRVLDLQLRLQHWLHAWLFVHVPVSYFLILFTAWHAYVTLFYY
jgi:hypothetical protein